MAESKLWHYKGLVRPVAGYAGPTLVEGALLAVVTAPNQSIAEVKVLEELACRCLVVVGDRIFEETDGVPEDLPQLAQNTYREATERGLAVHIQPFR